MGAHANDVGFTLSLLVADQRGEELELKGGDDGGGQRGLASGGVRAKVCAVHTEQQVQTLARQVSHE